MTTVAEAVPGLNIAVIAYQIYDVVQKAKGIKDQIESLIDAIRTIKKLVTCELKVLLLSMESSPSPPAPSLSSFLQNPILILTRKRP